MPPKPTDIERVYQRLAELEEVVFRLRRKSFWRIRILLPFQLDMDPRDKLRATYLLTPAEHDRYRERADRFCEALEALPCSEENPPGPELLERLYRLLPACAEYESEFYSPRLALSLLRALAAADDEAMLPNIARLADRPITEDRARERVCSAACSARDAIRARIERCRKYETLLRPAVAPEADTLLRPAQGPSRDDPTTLLRPASHDTDQK